MGLLYRQLYCFIIKLYLADYATPSLGEENETVTNKAGKTKKATSMTPRQQRMTLVAGILVGVSIAVGLALVAFQENINHFYTPTEIKQGLAPATAVIRAGGLVVEGSVNRAGEGLTVSFDLTDTVEAITVHYTGILPDLFREGQGIVAIGKLDADGSVVAEEVLAKHDENYMSPEVAHALEQAGKNGVQIKNPHE